MICQQDDVIYRYPDDDTLLFQLKGMFLTLGHMISDVATPPLLRLIFKCFCFKNFCLTFVLFLLQA